MFSILVHCAIIIPHSGDHLLRFFALFYFSLLFPFVFAAILEMFWPQKKTQLRSNSTWANRNGCVIFIVLIINLVSIGSILYMIIKNEALYLASGINILNYVLFIVGLSVFFKKDIVSIGLMGENLKPKIKLLKKYLSLHINMTNDNDASIYKSHVPYAVALEVKGYEFENNIDEVLNKVIDKKDEYSKDAIIKSIKTLYEIIDTELDAILEEWSTKQAFGNKQ